MNDRINPATGKTSSLLGSLLALVSPASRSSRSAALTQTELTEWMIQKIADATEMRADQIDLDTSFADFGLDSRTAVSMSAELERLVGRELPPTLIWDYPTIRDVTQYLCAPVAGSDDSK